MPDFKKLPYSLRSQGDNKTGVQPVSSPVERVHFLGDRVGIQSPFGAIAVQTVTLVHVKGAKKLCKNKQNSRILKKEICVLGEKL